LNRAWALAAAGALAALALGCGPGPRGGGDDGWSAPLEGLQIKVEVPGACRAGGEAVATLRMRNVSRRDLRIYLIGDERLRYGKSMLCVMNHNRDLVAVQPELITDEPKMEAGDFHLLTAGRELVFKQTLRFTEPSFDAGGPFVVRWRYENQLGYWRGRRAAALAGTPKPVRPGGAIPGIWIGELEAETLIKVMPEEDAPATAATAAR